MTYISDPTQNVTITIPYQGSTYTLKLKVNLRDKDESTGKLTDENQKTYQVGKNNIFWQGLNNEHPSIIPNKIKKIASSIYLKPTNNASAPFDVYMGANSLSETSHRKPIKNIVSVQTSEEFVAMFKEQSNALMDFFKQMIATFYETSSLNSLDVKEIVSLSEFLSPEERTQVVQTIRNSHSYDLLLAAIQARKTAGSANKIEEELINLIRFRTCQERPNFAQLLQCAQSLSPKMRRDLENDEAQGIRHFLNEFCSHTSQTEERTVAADVKIIKSWLYCGEHAPNIFPESQALSQTIQQLVQVEELNSSKTAHTRLLLMRTLLDISFVKNEETTLEKEFFDTLNLHETHKSKKGGYYHNAFLLQNSRQLLKFSSKEKTWLKSIDRPWQLLKFIGNELPSSTQPNFKEVQAHIPTIGSKKHLTFFYLYLLQTAYLKNNDDASDFNEFVDNLNDPERAAKNQALLPVHKHYNFVLGLIELLDTLATTSTNFQIRNKSLLLLKTIQNNNKEDNSASSTFFKIKSTSIRRYVVKQIKNILAIAEESNKQYTVGLSQIFQSTLQKKFPLIACLRSQYAELKNNPQFAESRRCMVELMAQSAKDLKPRPLSELVDERIFLRKKVIVLSALRGMGKTFFLQNYILSLLENFQPDKPFPFYLSARRLQNPRYQLMQSSIQAFNLSHCEEELQKNKTIWFFDDVETIFGESQGRYDGYNIFNMNLSGWSEAQFLFACDPTGFSAEDMVHFFTYNGKSVQKLDIVVSDENLIDRYLEIYIRDRQIQDLPTYSIEEYKKGIEHLGLKNVNRTPLFLRQAIDFLTEQKKEIFFDNQHPILDLWLAETLEKASKSSSRLHLPNNYLDYLLDVQRLMQICGTQSIQKKKDRPTDLAEADLQDLLFGNKSQLKIEALFKTSAEGAVEYCTPLLYDFLKEVRADDRKKQSLLRMQDQK